MKEIAFDYYKKNNNLNEFYYRTKDEDIRAKLDRWCTEFSSILSKKAKDSDKVNYESVLLKRRSRQIISK